MFLDLSVLHRKKTSKEYAGVRSSVLLPVLKDSVRRFSTSDFFHQSTPSRSLIYGLTPFRIWLRIRQDNRFENCQNQFFTFFPSSPLIFTFSSNNMYVMFIYIFVWLWFPFKGMRAKNRFREDSNSVIKLFCIRPRICQDNRENYLQSSDSVVSMKPRNPILRYH
jgi:hypothetical protein